MILKMNFNFNFKDMPFATGASMCDLTNGSDSHHTEKSGIKRSSRAAQSGMFADGLGPREPGLRSETDEILRHNGYKETHLDLRSHASHPHRRPFVRRSHSGHRSKLEQAVLLSLEAAVQALFREIGLNPRRGKPGINPLGSCLCRIQRATWEAN